MYKISNHLIFNQGTEPNGVGEVARVGEVDAFVSHGVNRI